MKKVEVDNPLKLDVFINGNIDVSLIPDDIIQLLASMLENDVMELVEKAAKKKMYNQTYRSKSKKSPP